MTTNSTITSTITKYFCNSFSDAYDFIGNNTIIEDTTSVAPNKMLCTTLQDLASREVTLCVEGTPGVPNGCLIRTINSMACRVMVRPVVDLIKNGLCFATITVACMKAVSAARSGKYGEMLVWGGLGVGAVAMVMYQPIR